MKILRVALDVPLDTLFDYLDADTGAMPGQRVLVPFGRRRTIGIVLARVSASDIPAERLKPILQAFEDEQPLPVGMLHLLRFCADYYHYPFGQALLSALPSRLREARKAQLATRTLFRLTEAGQVAKVEAIPARAVLQRKLYLALAHNPLDQEDVDRYFSRLARRHVCTDRAWVGGADAGDTHTSGAWRGCRNPAILERRATGDA